LTDREEIDMWIVAEELVVGAMKDDAIFSTQQTLESVR
jgi:hypothetical protein